MDDDNGHQVMEYFTIPFGSCELTKGFHFKCKLVANYNSQGRVGFIFFISMLLSLVCIISSDMIVLYIYYLYMYCNSDFVHN
jgi:hypothetical protein